MITSLHIENFKAYRNQQFSIGKLNLLAGLNGSGKSSLLQSLLVLRQSYDQGLLQKNRVILNGNLLRLGRFQEALFESADERNITFRVGFESGAEYSFHLSGWQAEDRTGPVGIRPGLEFPLEGLFQPGFRFLAAERIGPRTQYGMPDNEGLTAGVGISGEWTAFYLARNGEAPAPNSGTYHPSAVSSSLKHQVEAWMNEISPGLRLHSDPAETMDAVHLTYSFVARRDVSSKYRPTNVGFGVSYTLPLITTLVAASPGDLLLLESPEAHLHPRGQAKLGELLSRAASSGVQIIVESHSDHIMNEIRVAAHANIISASDVLFFYSCWNAEDRTGATQVQSIAMDQNGRIDRWPKGFFDEMDQSLAVLLMPKARRDDA